MKHLSFSAVTPLVAVILSASMFLSGCGRKADTITQAEKVDKADGTQAPGLDEVKDIAEQGFIYGLPLVMCYTANYEFWVDKSSNQYKGPMNQLFNERRVFTYKDTAVVTPNSDTPYSFVCLDLRAEPYVISVPAVEKARYYSVQLTDFNTFNFGYIGSRATGTESGDYLIAGPDWQGETPPGIKQVFHSTSQFIVAIFRTQLFNAADMPNVLKVQSGYKAQPLSAFLKKEPTAAVPAIDFPYVNNDLAKTNFFEYLDFVLQYAPAGPEEKEIRAKLARIGVGPGKKFNFKDLSVEHKIAILLGMQEGEKKVEEKVSSLGKEENGWRVAAGFGDRAFYNGDWLLRAAAAKAGIFGNDAIEALYPLTRVTGTGESIDASNNKYTLTFPVGQLPPVNAFWSVTMYDGKTQLLIENPINRYLINSPMLPQLKKNASGSLTLYIQKDNPGPDKESNWLPAPDGPVYLVMRAYWPKEETLNGSWQPPGVVKQTSNAAQP